MRTLSRIGEESSERAVVLVTHRLEEIPQASITSPLWVANPIPAEDATEAASTQWATRCWHHRLYRFAGRRSQLTSVSDLFGMPIEVQHTSRPLAAYAVDMPFWPPPAGSRRPLDWGRCQQYFPFSAGFIFSLRPSEGLSAS